MKKITAIIQARMGSTRLPGKIMKDLCGKPVLWHVHNRLSYAEKVDEIIIATTENKEDDIVEMFCKENRIPFYRGSENDVLNRYYEAAKLFDAKTIVRITSDCPLVEPRIVNKMIEEFSSANVDYLSNFLIRTFPRGLDAEIFTFLALEKAGLEAVKDYEREHVTPYIYQHPEIFSLQNFANNTDYSFHRWTLDTAEDFKLITFIYGKLYRENSVFSWTEVLNLFEKYPDIYQINKDIKQKEDNK